MLQGGSERPPHSSLRFLNDLRQLPDDIEDNFREVKDILGELLQINQELKEKIQSLQQSQCSTTSVSAFNARASNNIAVYYTQSSASNSQTDLRLLCAKPAVDIITLPLIATLNGPNGFPTFANTTDCLGPSASQLADAPNLRDCSNLAETITYCQSLGKKIIIGILGTTIEPYSPATNSSTITARTAFNSFDQRPHSAVMLLSLFGPPSTSSRQLTHLRPFGPNISVDGFDLGFDLDMTVHGSRTSADFVATLRDHTAQSGQALYVSATRPCRRPASPQTLATLALVDFVTVMFAHDPACSIAGPGFNIWDWSNDLRLAAADGAANGSSQGNGTAPLRPKLFAAALAWPSPAATANRTREGDPEYLGQSIGQIWESGRLGNLGGVALVEGGRGVAGGTWGEVGARSIEAVDAAIEEDYRERGKDGKVMDL
ncbi:hypothetical protein W97_08708 [Coniosporium apollinis CBS 100218]|uniref:Chitinase n=1 Tax=Coniosporium apollinis (strain CBS 100218) TaxID=1168221 RepID=R7Z5R7_CONA1|nr:uncharacterized protein W97_08708 [Coniosporium apollinis CBS 100218]EON69448.1 hypothetical protein W97_08708 [Coniosporium apollinis CBS 100218]